MDSDNASVLQIGESVISSNSYESTSHPPRSVKSFSNFGDSACGEPLLAQHLIIDFTPKEDIDSDFLQRKVCAFWEFVSIRPQLRDILVLPEPNMFKKTTSSDVTSKDAKYESRHSTGSKELTNDRTAVSMLEFVEERDYSYQRILKYSKRTQTTNICTTKARDGVRNMCKKMNQWDELHPKSMRSPQHPYSSHSDLSPKTNPS